VPAYAVHHQEDAGGFVDIDPILIVGAMLSGIAGYACPPLRRYVHGIRRLRQLVTTRPAAKIRKTTT
jgi:hypothetical protein